MEREQWQLQRRVSVSMIVQVITLAGLILGSWVNLQRQLDLVAHDVKLLLNNQEKFTTRLEALQEKTISQEYQIRSLERSLDLMYPDSRLPSTGLRTGRGNDKSKEGSF